MGKTGRIQGWSSWRLCLPPREESAKEANTEESVARKWQEMDFWLCSWTHLCLKFQGLPGTWSSTSLCFYLSISEPNLCLLRQPKLFLTKEWQAVGWEGGKAQALKILGGRICFFAFFSFWRQPAFHGLWPHPAASDLSIKLLLPASYILFWLWPSTSFLHAYEHSWLWVHLYSLG